jgi:signal transduction histidine kinase
LKYSAFIKVNVSSELLPVYHTAFSIALLIGMAGLYYHASKFYDDSFYLFIAIGWLLNLAYILFINISLGREDPAGLNFRSLTLLLALLSDLPFYLAGQTKPNHQARYKDLGFPFGIICVWAIVYFSQLDPLIKNRIHIAVAISFATYVSLRVYLSFRLRTLYVNLETTDPPETSDEVQPRSTFPQKLLLYNFLALAVIQLSFVFVLFETTKWFIIYILYFALFLKIVNAYALTIILREDYGNIRAQAERNEEKLRQERQERSEFQEIGLLTASIEHELRTPLGVLRSKLNDMGREYQHLDSVVADVHFLQTSKTWTFFGWNWCWFLAQMTSLARTGDL